MYWIGSLAREHVRNEESAQVPIEVPGAYFERVALFPAAARLHRGSSRQGVPSLPGLVLASG